MKNKGIKMNNELLATLDYIEQERGIDKNKIIEAIETSLVSASKKSLIHPAKDITVKVDRDTGDIQAWAKLEVVEDAPNADQITLKEVNTIHKQSFEFGEIIDWEVTPKNFGRIAARAAKQTIMQLLKRAEKENLQKEYSELTGTVLSGVVRRYEQGDIIVDIGKHEGILSPRDQIPGENYSSHERINALLVKVDIRNPGPSLILTRRNKSFIQALFEREITEIKEGIVEIKNIARDPGVRTKIAVKSNDDQIDAVGACVGLRGVRIRNITNELGGERIDIVPYDEDTATYITNALQPAKIKSIEIDEELHNIIVHVTTDQARLAFGRKAQNVRLASKLLGWRVNIVEDKDQEKEDKKNAFEEQKQNAIKSLSQSLKVDETIATKLVSNGYLTIDGLKETTKDDLMQLDIEENIIVSILELLKNM